MQGRFFLDVVVGQSSAIFELFSGENESLLVWWNALLVLDFGFDVVDCVAGFDFEGDGLARQGLDEDLHRDGTIVCQYQGRKDRDGADVRSLLERLDVLCLERCDIASLAV